MEVPAKAVKVNSLGSYSTMPRRPEVESLVAWTSDRRDLVPEPTARSEGQERTASSSAGTEAGARRALIRGKGARLFRGDEGRAVGEPAGRHRGTSCPDWRCRADRRRRAIF